MAGKRKYKDPLAGEKVFPTRLRGLMAEQQITRQDLAQTLGVTRQAVSNYLDGSSSPSWESIVLISQTLGVTSDYLLGISDYRRVESQGITLSEVGFSETVIKHLVEAELYHPRAIEGLNILLNHSDALEIFPRIVDIATISADAISQLDSGGRDLLSLFFEPSFDKDSMRITMDIDSYLSFEVENVCNIFRAYVRKQTSASGLADRLEDAFKQGSEQALKDSITAQLEGGDPDGIHTQENN